jgi:aspartate oxidase
MENRHESGFMERDPDAPMHERINLLDTEGYRGFKVTQKKKKWDGIEIDAGNSSNKILSAGGETGEEAYKKLIDLIDLTLDG